MLKNLLGGLAAFWAMITFIITFLVFFIPSMICWLIPDPLGQDIFIRIARIWMRIWLPLAGCPIRIKGKQNFKKGENYIVTCNHNSLMDVPLSCPFIPGPNKTIAKSSFAKIPLFGWYYMKGGILVDRKRDQSRRRSFEKMKTVLAAGMHMSVYPEGTRNRTDQPLKSFHSGAFRLAVETGKAIIPAVIFHTKKVLPPGKKFFFQPHKLEMHFLEAIRPQGLSIEELKQRVYLVMQDYYVRVSGE
jgi:1-acyl-sn-glycerol-3-phosphate acyltransferase